MQTHKQLVAIACEECESQANLARAIGLSPAMVNQMMRGDRNLPMEHGAAIEVASNGRVKRWDFFPDDWDRIWPELIGTPGAPEVPQPTPQPTDQPATEITQGVANV